MESRLSHTIKNFSSGVALKCIDIIFPFVIKTILIKFLGVEYLGLNGLFTSILQILNLAELGMSSAIVFSMYKPIAEENYEEIGAIYRFYKKVYTFIGITIAIAGIVLMPFLHYIVNDDVPNAINMYFLYLIYLVDAVISYFLFAYKECLLTAYQLSNVSNKINMFVHIFRYVLQIIAIIFCRSYYVYAILIPVSTVIINIVRSNKVNQLFPQIKCQGEITKSTKDALFKRVGGLVIYKVSDVLRDSFDSIVISAFIGLRTLALYQNYLYILKAVYMVFSTLISSMTASVGNSIVTESKDKNYQDLNTLTFIYNWGTCFCSAALLCLYQPFMRLWLGKEYLFENYLVAIFCVYFYMMCISMPLVVYRYACGIWWQDRYRPIVESVCNIVINILVVKYFGVCGVLISTIVCLMFINIPWGSHILFKEYFEMTALPYLWDMLRNFMVTCGVCCITYAAAWFIKGNYIVMLFGRGIIVLFVSNACLWVCYRKREEYNKTRKKVTQVMKNKLKIN